MAFGIGVQGDIGYGDPDSWGGPMDGVDVEQSLGASLEVSSRLPQDTWQFVFMIAAIIGLWVMGGLLFKSVRL